MMLKGCDPVELKWYAPARWLGLVKDISHEYNDGFTHYTVSAQTGDIFAYLTLSLLPLLFVIGLLMGLRQKERAIRMGVILLLIYAVLLAVGIGPYIELYPQGSGFIDLSALEHFIEGIYTALLALSLYLGGRLGRKCKKQ